MFINRKGQVVPITGKIIEPYNRSLDGPEFSEKLEEFFTTLNELSEQPTQKMYRMRIVACDGSFWSWEFEFSDEEIDLARQVVRKLKDRAQGRITAPVFVIRKSSDQIKDDDDVSL